MANAKKLPVTLRAVAPVKVDGVDLPAADYPGTETRIQIRGPGGFASLPPEYLLHMSASVAKNLPGWENTLGAELEATANVRNGELLVI